MLHRRGRFSAWGMGDTTGIGGGLIRPPQSGHIPSSLVRACTEAPLRLPQVRAFKLLTRSGQTPQIRMLSRHGCAFSADSLSVSENPSSWCEGGTGRWQQGPLYVVEYRNHYLQESERVYQLYSIRLPPFVSRPNSHGTVSSLIKARSGTV